MADNKNKQGRQDDVLIDSQDPGELRYAAEAWGITPQDILDAIKATGSNSRKVIREYLFSSKS